MPVTTRFPSLLLLGLILFLQGCGFQLRGTQSATAELPTSISPLHITGLDRGSYLKTQLENRFIESDIQVSAEPVDIAATLRIRGLRSDRRVLAVDNRGKVIEYLLTERLSFDLIDSAGKQLVSGQSVDLSQSYINPEEQVLGALQEERSLREDMWRRMADQILRRLAAQLR